MPPTVADAMHRFPKLCAPHETVADLRVLFLDRHVHAALIVANGRLRTVVERGDLASAADDRRALELGRLEGRTIDPTANLEDVRQRMVNEQIRRLAVVDRQMRLLGLLCLKRSGLGFCSDADVAERAAERTERSGR